jgi:hypothetical protein
MSLSYDERFLITTGLDSTICFWKISYIDGTISALYGNFLYLDQILISRNDLGNKVQNIKDLQSRLKELEAEHEYKTRQKTLQHNDKLLEIHQSYCEAIEELRDKIDNLEQDHTNEINNINVEIDKTKKSHEEAMYQMEIGYNAKLIFEYDKFSKLEEQCETITDDYEAKLETLEKTSKAELGNNNLSIPLSRMRTKIIIKIKKHLL